MKHDQLPAPLARLALRVAPLSFQQRMIDILMHSMRRDHASLFRNLERLSAATVLIEPSDLPHQFVLTFGGGKASLALATAKAKCSAGIKGKLESLLNLLEGRIDGDMLFFSREIEITGNTSVIVALRNTLDREEINLLDDVTALLGPFALPARKLTLLMGIVAERMKTRCEKQEAA